MSTRNVRFFRKFRKRIGGIMVRLYAYKCIQAEETRLQEKFASLPVNGKKTTGATIRNIKELKMDATYRLAQKCNIIVSWHRTSIQGQSVVLGDASIILPDCAIVSLEQLKEIEQNHIE